MAIILIIDKEHESIHANLKDAKGLFLHSVSSVSDSLPKLNSEQFDIILCRKISDLNTTKEFLSEISKHQPSEMKLFWIIGEGEDLVTDEILSLRNSTTIKYPIDLKSIGLDNLELFNQEDIDSLL